MKRRALLLAGLASPAIAGIRRGRVFAFPRDHGTHLEARTEWWYATGWTGTQEAPRCGFQLTFFRSRTGLAETLPGRFAPRHILFAHAAVTDLLAQRHHHAQRIARWSGERDSALAFASSTDGEVRLADWRLVREAGGWRARLPASDFAIDLLLAPSQPPMLQGEAGLSRKGPLESQASHYYSEPQLAVSGRLKSGGVTLSAQGRAWLDREWSDSYLAPEAMGWDWVGFNLFDGSALMAFRIRRADGSALWAGGGFRTAGGVMRDFSPAEVRFAAGRRWTSPATQAAYPVEWTLATPAGEFRVRSLLDAQELDGRAHSGAVYWEGLSELLDTTGRRVGLGYLELTGYAAKLRMS